MTTESTESSYPYLDEEFTRYLRDRAVTREIALERGYRIVRPGKKDGGGDFAAAWGFPRSLGGLLIPLHSMLDNDPADKVQLRVFDDLMTPDPKTGRLRKFRNPTGQKSTLATAPRTRDLLSQKGQTIIVAEGVTRVDALAAFDIPAVGLAGVWNWRSATALPDWEYVVTKGNRFVVVPDGDVRLNPNPPMDGVRTAEGV